MQYIAISNFTYLATLSLHIVDINIILIHIHVSSRVAILDFGVNSVPCPHCGDFLGLLSNLALVWLVGF